MTDVDLNGRSRRKSPGTQYLKSIRLAPDPTAEKLTLIRVAAEIVDIEVIESREKISPRTDVTLSSKTQARDLWNVGKIESRRQHAVSGVIDREWLVVGKCVNIAGQPIAKLGETILHIDSRATISRVIPFVRCAY